MRSGSKDTFHPIPNPYIVGNPIEDRRMFFGREDDFEFIRKKVTGGTKGGLLVLCGARRSGKTSILKQIKNGHLGSEFIPVLIDMQAMTVQSDAEFLTRLAHEIVEIIEDPSLLLDSDFRSVARENPFNAFHGLISRIASKVQGRKLVLMFDEYELFESLIDRGSFSKDVLNLLANWMEHREGVFIIFTGSDKLEERNTHHWQSFLGKALHRRISFLTRRDTLRLIEEPLVGVVDYDSGVPEEIHCMTAGQPFYTQVLCQSLVDHLNESKSYHVVSENVEQVVDEIIENPLPQMIFTWSSLSDLEKVSLSIVAELSKDAPRPILPKEVIAYPREEQIGYRIDANRVRESMERLFHHDLLEKDTQAGTYTFKMDLWRRWVTRLHSIWQVIDEVGGAGRELGEGIRSVKSGTPRLRILAGVAAVVLLGGLPVIYGIYSRLDSGPEPRPPVVWADSTLFSVDTQPRGASVFLDDLRIGKSPIADQAIPAERSVLRIELPGYKVYTDTLDLRKDEPWGGIISLVQRCGSLRVSSEPSGAVILVDGKQHSQLSPATIADLSVNRSHRVWLQMTGYEDTVYQDIQASEDSIVTMKHVFSRSSFPLTIVSEPTDADIYVDGHHKGRTPGRVGPITEGVHELELRKDGFQREAIQIRIPAPDNLVRISLNPSPPGTLIFEIAPYGEIWLDGEMIEEMAQWRTLSRPPGIYEIQLRHPVYPDTSLTVDLRPGERKTIIHRFGDRGGSQ